MSLKQRIDTALQATGRWALSDYGDPRLSSLLAGQGGDYKPVVLTRYAGKTIFGGLRRPQVDVVVVFSIRQSSLYSAGDGLEAYETRLVEDLRLVDDVYPETLPSEVDYNFRLTPGRGKGAGEYVAIIVSVLGA